MRYYEKIAALGILLIPQLAFAATIRTFTIAVTDFVGSALMPLLFAAALAYFIWGIIEFIRNANNSEARRQGKTRMLWGIIALFVMVAYLGLTSTVTQTFFNFNAFLPQLFTN